MSLTMGLTLGLTSLYGRRSVDSDVAALIGAMNVAPNESQASIISTHILMMKTLGLWNDIELFYVLASHDAQAARLNWKSRANDFALVGSPVFAAGQGYAGDGVAAGLRVASWAPGIVAQNSAAFGLYTRIAASYDGAAARYSLYTGTVNMLRRNNNAANYQWRVHDGTSGNTAVAAQTGHHAVRRTLSNERSLWENGAQVATDASVSTAVSSRFELFNANGIGWGDGQISIAYAARAFTNQQMIDMNTVIASLKTAIGF